MVVQVNQTCTKHHVPFSIDLRIFCRANRKGATAMKKYGTVARTDSTASLAAHISIIPRELHELARRTLEIFLCSTSLQCCHRWTVSLQYKSTAYFDSEYLEECLIFSCRSWLHGKHSRSDIFAFFYHQCCYNTSEGQIFHSRLASTPRHSRGNYTFGAKRWLVVAEEYTDLASYAGFRVGSSIK